MKRLLSFLIAASALLISTVGAIATTLPMQSDYWPNYIFDVTYGDTVVGKVGISMASGDPTYDQNLSPWALPNGGINMVNRDPTYALVADGLTPNTNYIFGYSMDTPESVNLLGSADTSETGRLRMRGKIPDEDVTNLIRAQFWVMDHPPTTSYYEEIVGLRLFNWGGVIVQIQAYYSTDEGVTWQKSGSTDNIWLPENDYVDLSELGVPEGALVKIHVIVKGAKDKTASEVFRFSRWNLWVEIETYAAYCISGTAFKTELQYWGLYEPGEACP
jgi:hypothetical protein